MSLEPSSGIVMGLCKDGSIGFKSRKYSRGEHWVGYFKTRAEANEWYNLKEPKPKKLKEVNEEGGKKT